MMRLAKQAWKWKTKDEDGLFVQSDRRICFFVFYCGHGGMANYNYLYLNEPDKDRQLYGLEQKIREMAKLSRNFSIISLWDCCREKITDAMLNPIKARQ